MKPNHAASLNKYIEINANKGLILERLKGVGRNEKGLGHSNLW